MRKPPKKHHQKRSTRARVEQPSLPFVALLFIGALTVWLASNDQLTANAVTMLGAVTTALVVLIKLKR